MPDGALRPRDEGHEALLDLLKYQNWWDATSPWSREAEDAEFEESEHPRDEGGKFTSGTHGFGKKADNKPPKELHGVAFEKWTDHPKDAAGWEAQAAKGADFKEPGLPDIGTYENHKGETKPKRRGAGVVIREPDGRVWIVHPTGGYGGYKATFPKGGVDKGMSTRATAIKEAFEESGLKVELTGYAGDVDRDTSNARYYFARRVGGSPEHHGWESEKVTLAEPGELAKLLNRTADRKFAASFAGPEDAKQAEHRATPAKPAPNATLSTATMKKVGKQLGSNPGGQYEDADGKRYYVKQSKSLDHAKNEITAGLLYEAAGSPILAGKPVDVGDGKLGTATAWEKVTPIDRHDAEQRKEAQQDFATHAWLANWDAAGLEYDNQGRIGGKMHTLDAGGSLIFRAQGGPKGSAFGDSVGEWDTLRSKSNAQAHAIFGSMTGAQLRASAKKVASVPDAKIREIVEEHGPGTPEQRKKLADRLIARKMDIATRASKLAQDAEFRESEHHRGQPGNKGQFGPGGGGGAKPQAAPRKTQSAPAKNAMQPLDRSKPLPPHIAKLVIPPAWTDVHYASDPKAKKLVTGRDALRTPKYPNGRPVAIYSADATSKSAAAKFARVQELIRKFDKVVAQNEAAKKDPATRDVAEALDLVLKMGIRPGSERDTGAQKQAYGATTLEGRHVVSTPEGIRLRFTGKKGVDLDLPVADPGLAKMLTRRAAKAGPTGQLFNVDNRRLLAHTHSMDGGSFKTKDLRTRLGTQTALDEVARRPLPADASGYKKAVREVAKVVSAKLGNTATVALQSYIAPEAFAPWRHLA